MNKALIVIVLTSFAAACGTTSSTAPSSSTASMAGTWAGTASDSSSTMGTGSMMGQVDMGAMTWQLSQSGSTVTGSMSFAGSGMQNRMPGTFKGTMSGDDITFTMEMPAGSMMSAACQSTATGTGHVNRTTMIMTGTYTGTNVCTGMYTGGQTWMTHR
jgi:hypothetical protein